MSLTACNVIDDPVQKLDKNNRKTLDNGVIIVQLILYANLLTAQLVMIDQ